MPNKPKTPQPQTPNNVQGKDLFQTPAYATRLLVPFIPKHITQIWECASGSGFMTRVFVEEGYSILSSDIDTYGRSYVLRSNFLSDPVPDQLILDWNSTAIITNPPFSLKKKFFEKCIEYNIPFALLIPADYSVWTIDAVRKYGCEKIIPDHRINYITPTGKSGEDSSSKFHSFWLTRFFNLGKSETFVELTKEMMQNV